MNKTIAAVVALALMTGSAMAQQKNHEAACIAGTVAGVLLGGAVGGLFGNGVGRTLMTAAGATAGGMLTHKQSCKN